MRCLILAGLLTGLLISGCGRQGEPEKVASLQTQVTTLETELQRQTARNETLQSQVTELDGKLRDAESERAELRLQLQRADSSDRPDESTLLRARVMELEAVIEAMKEAAAADGTTEPITEPAPTAEDEPTIDVEAVKQKLEELWPLVKAGDRKALGEVQDRLQGANKETRDSYIQRVKDWVTEEPANKHARITLAAALSTRFQDLTDPMKMGALAGEMKQETVKALEIDPDYYEAQHFLAILQVNYPSFTQEFKEADKSLDRALELQSNMVWEDRFGDIYAAYGMWYRVQDKLDEAGAKVQAGLDMAPRHQALLDEQQRIEAARNTEEK